MPRAVPKIRRRDLLRDADAAHQQRVEFFCTAGRYRPRAAWVKWLPFIQGRRLRSEWMLARTSTRSRVARDAFRMLDDELGEGGLARAFHHWPPDRQAALAQALGLPPEPFDEF